MAKIMRGNKKRIIVYAVWGNIIGFFSMRLLGKASDYTPFFENNRLEDFFYLLIFFIILGVPGAYFFATEREKTKNHSDIGGLSLEILGASYGAFFLGLFGIILGRIL